MSNENTVVLPREEYEEYIDTETRVSVLLTLLKEDGVVSVREICLILGRPDVAKEIEKKEEKKREEYRKMLAERGKHEGIEIVP